MKLIRVKISPMYDVSLAVRNVDNSDSSFELLIIISPFCSTGLKNTYFECPGHRHRDAMLHPHCIHYIYIKCHTRQLLNGLFLPLPELDLYLLHRHLDRRPSVSAGNQGDNDAPKYLPPGNCGCLGSIPRSLQRRSGIGL